MVEHIVRYRITAQDKMGDRSQYLVFYTSVKQPELDKELSEPMKKANAVNDARKRISQELEKAYKVIRVEEMGEE